MGKYIVINDTVFNTNNIEQCDFMTDGAERANHYLSNATLLLNVGTNSNPIRLGVPDTFGDPRYMRATLLDKNSVVESSDVYKYSITYVKSSTFDEDLDTELFDSLPNYTPIFIPKGVSVTLSVNSSYRLGVIQVDNENKSSDSGWKSSYTINATDSYYYLFIAFKVNSGAVFNETDTLETIGFTYSFDEL